SLRQAVDLLQPIHDKAPQDRAVRENLGAALMNLALMTHTPDGRAETDFLRRALGLYEKLVADFPDAPEYRRRLAGVAYNFGNNRLIAGALAEADQAYGQALAENEALLKTRPNDRAALQGKAQVLNAVSVLRDRAGKPAEAVAASRRAVQAAEFLA